MGRTERIDSSYLEAMEMIAMRSVDNNNDVNYNSSKIVIFKI